MKTIAQLLILSLVQARSERLSRSARRIDIPDNTGGDDLFLQDRYDDNMNDSDLDGIRDDPSDYDYYKDLYTYDYEGENEYIDKYYTIDYSYCFIKN